MHHQRSMPALTGRRHLLPNADIAREYLETWNRRDWDHYRSMMHAGYSYTGGDGEKMFAGALPDGVIEIQTVHDAGDTVVVEFIGKGTHNGDLMGVAPTGRRVNLPVCNVIEIRDGKIFGER